MEMNHPANLFAGVDNLSLDKRKFDPSRDDIERICLFFSIGKLRHFENEKGIIVSHSNFFIFVATTHGQYALKFYPPDEAKAIAVEYAINRLLTDHHFLTPLMYAGHGGQPFFASNGRLATCFSFIDGLPAWQHIKLQHTFRQINSAMLSLKNILFANRGRIPFLEQESLMATINTLTKNSHALAPYDQKGTIDTSLLDAYRTCQHHPLSFTRQLLHNNITLTNILISEKNVYILDLSHIRKDYAFCDLASMVISCLFFDIPIKTIKAITKDYFNQHRMEIKHSPALNILVKMGLIREYLKNIQREKSVKLSNLLPDLAPTYIAHLSKRKKSITNLLKKMNDLPRLIV